MSPAELQEDMTRLRPRFRLVSSNSLNADDDSEEIRRTALTFDEQMDVEAMSGDESDAHFHSLDSSISLLDTSDAEDTPENSTTRRRIRGLAILNY